MSEQNRKKRRPRGDGVTSYKITSILTLTSEAQEKQKQAYIQQAQQQAAQQPGYDPNAYPQQGYYDPNDPNAYPQQGYYDPNDPNAYPQQGYYDPNDPNAYQQQGYYDPNDPNAYPQQGYYDPNDPNAPQQGYYDPNDPNAYQQQGYDPNDPNAYQQQGYYDPNDPNAYQQQGYDPNDPNAYQQQGYYDPNDPNAYQQQGYYDPNDPNAYQQQGYDPNHPQEGSYPYSNDPNAYQQQGYYDPNDPNAYAQQGYYEPPPEPQVPQKRKKPKTIEDAYRQMLGEGEQIASDSEWNNRYIGGSHPAGPLPSLPLPPSGMSQVSERIKNYYGFVKNQGGSVLEKFFFYIDMLLEISEQIQKELKEAIQLAYKGFLAQMKSKAPAIVPYSNPAGDYAQAPAAPGYYPPPIDLPRVSFVELQELNVEFTDNQNNPLFNFKSYENSQYTMSKMIVDPVATEGALYAIRECAQRAAAIPPATEGPYAHMPLQEVLSNITEDDLQGFLRYVKTFPGNYVARSLKISETFATWVVYGAPSP